MTCDSRLILLIGMFLTIAGGMATPNAEAVVICNKEGKCSGGAILSNDPGRQSNTDAVGLLGIIVQAAGRTTGIKPLEDLGRNADAEHRRFKDNNPVYKNLEETTSEMVRTPFSLACTATFETIVGSVRAMCSGFSSQSIGANEHAVIEQAKRRLLELGVTSEAELSGISIRWCQGNFSGYGITPGPSEIILNHVLLSQSLDDVALTLAHELHHVRQFHSIGAGPFKCNYSQQFIQCGGCQDQRHAMEREAYQFEAAVADKMKSKAQINPNSRLGTFVSLRGTGTFLDDKPLFRREPEAPSVRNQMKAAVAKLAKETCTLEAVSLDPVPVDKVAPCIDDLEVIYDETGRWMIDDFEKNDLEREKYYRETFQTDIDAACQILAHTVKSESWQKTRVSLCKHGARSSISKLLEIVAK